MASGPLRCDHDLGQGRGLDRGLDERQLADFDDPFRGQLVGPIEYEAARCDD
jgi:hypothetical protein